MAAAVCPKCGRPHSVEEVNQNRFCRNCGEFLKRIGKEPLIFKEGNGREKASPTTMMDYLELFPYKPYPQQLEFMRDVETSLSSGGVLVAEACNGFGKTACALSTALPLGRKIIYATRTHEQVRQVLREVARINKKADADFSAVALASRQNLCLNEVCRRLPPIDAMEACRVLRQARRCPYKTEFTYSASSYPLVLSTRMLLRYGRARHLCPYFLSRKASENCTVVVAPYQYVFDEAVRAMVKLDIGGKILIFDEAHNADKISQEVLSDTLSERGLTNAKKELELAGAPSLFLDDLVDYMDKSISEEAILKPGSELLLDLRKILGQDLPFFVDTLMPAVEEIRDYKISQGEVPVCYLNGVLNFVSLVDSSEKDSYVAVYRRSPSGLNLIEYRCLDPSLAVKPVIEEAHAALIMSGTLSPLDLFAEVLGLSKAETRTYSAIAKPGTCGRS